MYRRFRMLALAGLSVSCFAGAVPPELQSIDPSLAVDRNGAVLVADIVKVFEFATSDGGTGAAVLRSKREKWALSRYVLTWRKDWR